jgi:SAM-dependent methyltransferase
MSTSRGHTSMPRSEGTQDRSTTGSPHYLLAGQVSELERLQLQSRVWEPSGRRLLEEIGDGSGAHALDVGCGVLGWLRVLSEWVGAGGQVTGADIDVAMLESAQQFVADEGLANVSLIEDDLFASKLEPDSFELVHARYEICPLGRAHAQMEPYTACATWWRDRAGGPRPRIVALQSARACFGASHRADPGRVSAGWRRLGGGADAPKPA